MDKNYQNKLFSFLNSIQRDLKDNKIDEKQFNFLLGLFLRNELNNMVNKEIADITPKNDNIQNMTFLTYKRSRKFNYVN